MTASVVAVVNWPRKLKLPPGFVEALTCSAPFALQQFAGLRQSISEE